MMFNFIFCFVITSFVWHITYSEKFVVHNVSEKLPHKMEESHNASEKLSHEMIEILNMSAETHCQIQVFERESFEISSEKKIYIPMYNKTFPSSIYRIVKDKLVICLNESEELFVEGKNSTFDEHSDCIELIYEPDEYELLPNGSIYLIDKILPDEMYEIYGGKLIVCDPEAGDYYYERINSINKSVVELHKTPSDATSIYVGNIASSISIVSLLVYLLIFCKIPDLRNLPGWNLTSMNIALLLAYSTFLIGQIPAVIGRACFVSAVLQQYFFLSAFFWMNVMSFDVWRALKNATERLTVSLNEVRNIKFSLYSAYGWGMPLVSTIASIIVENNEDAPEHLRPKFGKGNICWFTSNGAKALFFGIPGTVIFVVNFVLFLLSCYIIVHNTMENSNDRNSAKRNFILYARLSVMMGVMWLIGVIAVFSSKNLWIVFNLLLSSQGTFVLLLFAFTGKVWRYFRRSMAPGSRTSSFREPAMSMSTTRKVSRSSLNQS